LHVACCTLHVACCRLYAAACCMLHSACNLQHATCYMLASFAACCMLYVVTCCTCRIAPLCERDGSELTAPLMKAQHGRYAVGHSVARKSMEQYGLYRTIGSMPTYSCHSAMRLARGDEAMFEPEVQPNAMWKNVTCLEFMHDPCGVRSALRRDLELFCLSLLDVALLKCLLNFELRNEQIAQIRPLNRKDQPRPE
jgi:hypothetical protein